MSTLSPASRTLAQLRANGWHAVMVEHWNSFARIRQDLLGFGDILAIQPGSILLVQATTFENMKARIEKIRGLETHRKWHEAGGHIEVWGWRRPKKGQPKWEPEVFTVLREEIA